MAMFLNTPLPYKRYKKISETTYFVDKSPILNDIFGCIAQDALIMNIDDYECYVCTQGRFGKTIMANMLGAFFGKAWDASQIFDHLKIADSPEYHQYLNQYDIIYIDFSRLPENCTSYRQYIDRIITGLKNDLAEAYPEYQTDSIYALWDILSQISEQTDRQFVFIMDEWDAVFHLPFITEKEKAEYILFLKTLLKDQDYTALAYIAGEGVDAKIDEFAASAMELKSRDQIYSAMVVYGLLTYSGGKVFIPNRELMFKYEELLQNEESLGYVYQLAKISNQMLRATLSRDTQKMSEILQYAHNTESPILSYNNEVELSAIVNLVYLSARNKYRIEREDKVGKGFVDFIFYPWNLTNTCIILELKVDHSPEDALLQIREKDYLLRFQGKSGETRKYTGEVLGVGISYDKETKEHFCKVEVLSK